jgi:hypothetical protein
MNASEALKRCREVVHSVKSCRASNAVTSTAATYLLAVRQASFRWHELYMGLITELGNLLGNAKGKAR